MAENNTGLERPRIAMVSTHGYVAVAPPLGAADTGGQVVYVLELSKKLAQLGYAIDIWTRRFEDQPETDPVSEHVRIIRAPCGGPKFIPKEVLYENLPEWRENALRYIRNQRLSYAFVNSHYWDGGLAGQHLAQALDIPHAHTPHSLGIWKQRQMTADSGMNEKQLGREFNFERRIQKEREIYQSCNLLVATTPVQLDLFEEDYQVPAQKCRMIPPGYDDNRFYPVSDASRQALRHRLGLSGRVILAVGRLATNKGYDLLVDAFTIVTRRYPDAHLLLAVGGTELNATEQKLLHELREQVAKLGLEQRVRFVGFIPDEALADYYRAADEFVLPSRYEPFGMAAIEAMASGTPVVVTIHGGLWRAVTFGRHGLFGDPLDREDFGIMMTKPFQIERLRGRLSRMGAHKARSLFTWTGVAQQLVTAMERRPSQPFSLVDTDWDEPWSDGD